MNICRQAGEWLLSVQRSDGAFCGYEAEKPLVFDTGQVVTGLLALYQLTEDDRYLQAAQRAGDWLLIQQAADGSWVACAYGGVPHSYYSLVSVALIRLGIASGDQDYILAARKNLDWVANQQLPNGWFRHSSFFADDQAVLHTIAYTLQGLVEAGELLHHERYLKAAEFSADCLKRAEPEGLPFGFYDSQWRAQDSSRCLTGLAQMGWVWAHLDHNHRGQGNLVAAENAFNYLTAHQTILTGPDWLRGAIAGSAPLWGSYLPFTYPNWSVKFFIDLAVILDQRGALGRYQWHRALVVSYFFPPIHSVESTMALNIVKYLPDHDWGPVVIAARRSKEWGNDVATLGGISARLEIKRTLSQENWAIRLFNHLGLVADSAVGWLRYAVRTSGQLLCEKEVDAVISRSNPFTSHLVARYLVNRYHPRLPWIAIFGDPWATNPYASKRNLLVQMYRDWLERTVIRQADAILVSTELTKQWFVDRYGGADKIHVFPNTYDPAELRPFLNNIQSTDHRLNITYAGTLYGLRSPESLFRALKIIRDQQPDIAKNLCVNLAGSMPQFIPLVAQYQLEDIVKCTGLLPREDALNQLANSQVLLLIDAPSGVPSIFLPAKLVEYIAFHKPILAITPPGTSADLIAATNTGIVVDPGDITGLVQAIIHYYRLHQADRLQIQPDLGEINRYSATHYAERLAKVLNGLVSQ